MATYYGWGYMLTVKRDQGRTAHLLKGDGSPACGARYFASAGQSQHVSESSKCLRCKRIAVRAS